MRAPSTTAGVGRQMISVNVLNPLSLLYEDMGIRKGDDCAVSKFDGYPLLPETETDGFVFGLVTPLGAEPGAGFLQGPDGTRAGIQWELSESPFIMRLEGPSGDGWGLYRVGFVKPVASVADLVENLGLLLPKLKVLYSRARGSLH